MKKWFWKSVLGLFMLFCLGMAGKNASKMLMASEMESLEEEIVYEEVKEADLEEVYFAKESKEETEYAGELNPEKEAEDTENAEDIENTVSAAEKEEVQEEREPETLKGDTESENREASDSEEPLREKMPDFQILLHADAEEKRAGSEILYEAVLSNTGETGLESIHIRMLFSEEMTGEFEEAEGLFVDEERKTATLKELKQGESKTIFYRAWIPEERNTPLECTLQTEAEVEDRFIKREAENCTVILPLTVDYQAEKSADRSVAHPGETVFYTILIRNTGERTLHSVVTTERFLREGVQAVFLSQKGILFNIDRTQACIRELLPGEEVSLKAEVVIPEDVAGEEMINQVYVLSEETGSVSIQAEASIWIEEAEKEELPEEKQENIEVHTEKKEEGIYSPEAVQTGDTTDSVRWIRIGTASVLLIMLIFAAKKARR